MDALCLVSKLPDTIIFERSGDQDPRLVPCVAIETRMCARGSKDEIAMGIWNLIIHTGLCDDLRIEGEQACQKKNTSQQPLAVTHHYNK
jgi:hypothetical protein